MCQIGETECLIVYGKNASKKKARVANREVLLARDDDQALATHTKRGRKKPYFQKETHKEPQPPNKFNNKESHPRRFQKRGQRKGKRLLICAMLPL
jgi:hypothetical protein